MFRKTTIFFFSLLFAVSLWQKTAAGVNHNKLTSTITDQEDTTLTIYNSDLGLVKDLRTLRIPVGEVEIKFMDVASKIDPASVYFKSLTDPAALSILEQSYEFDLITHRKLMEKYLGKMVTLVDRIKGGEEEIMMDARLISVENGYVYQVGDRIHIGHPGRVVLKEMPENLNTSPTLVWILKNEQENEQMVEVSYLTRGINWKSDYVVVVDEKDERIDLTGWVTITNKSGVTYQNTSLRLIAGDVHRIKSPRLNEERRFKSVEAGMKPQFKEKDFFEYHLYSLDRPTTIKDNQIKQLTLLAANAVPARKFFTFEGMDRFYWNRRPQKSIKKVKVKLQIDNTKEAHLGLPLPGGKIRIYKADSNGGRQFIGEDEIEHTPRHEKISLTIGSAFDIVGEHRQTSFKKINKNTIEESFQIKIRNQKEENVTVAVIEHLSGDWEITHQNQEWVSKDADTIEFQLAVPAGREANIIYTVVAKR